MKYRLAGIAALAVLAWLLPYGLNAYAIHVVDVALIFAVLAIGGNCAAEKRGPVVSVIVCGSRTKASCGCRLWVLPYSGAS